MTSGRHGVLPDRSAPAGVTSKPPTGTVCLDTNLRRQQDKRGIPGDKPTPTDSRGRTRPGRSRIRCSVRGLLLPSRTWPTILQASPDGSWRACLMIGRSYGPPTKLPPSRRKQSGNHRRETCACAGEEEGIGSPGMVWLLLAAGSGQCRVRCANCTVASVPDQNLIDVHVYRLPMHQVDRGNEIL